VTTYFHLVPTSRMRGAIPPLPNTPSWRDTHLKHKEIKSLLTMSVVLRITYNNNNNNNGDKYNN
jgi:hypothetical protein